MKKKLLIAVLGVVILCVGGFFLWNYLFAESPETQIRRTFQELSTTVGKNGKEGLIVAMEKARDAAAFFDDVCTLKLDRVPHGVGAMSRQNITANTLTLRNYFPPRPAVRSRRPRRWMPDWFARRIAGF